MKAKHKNLLSFKSSLYKNESPLRIRTDLKVFPLDSATVACAILNRESGRLFLNSMIENMFDSNVFRIIYSDGSAVIRTSYDPVGILYPFNTFSDVYEKAFEIQKTQGAIAKEDSKILLDKFDEIIKNLFEV